MKQRFNHSPFVYDVAVPFTGLRLKDPYYITCKDGTKIDAYPNGGGWSIAGGRIVEDEEVTHIALCIPGESKWETMTGGWRIDRDIDYFGTTYPMWCGTEYGFLYPDEVPEGYITIPVELYAYRDRKNPEAQTKLFVAQAKILKEEDGDNNATLDKIREYVQHPAFWLDPNTSVMSSAEIQGSIYGIARFLRNLREHKARALELVALFEECGISQVAYVPGFWAHLRRFHPDDPFSRAEHEVLRADPTRFVTHNSCLKPSAREERLKNFINSTRGPLPNRVDRAEWNHLRDFVHSPLDYHNCLRAKRRVV